MERNRMEAFSDGVLAIIITIMVLELTIPKDYHWEALLPVLPTILAYLLSFVLVGTYWANHHHLLSAVEEVNGRILWANLAWLFCISLIPFATAWMGKHPFRGEPAFLYAVFLLLTALSYHVLQLEIVRQAGKDAPVAKSLGKNVKGKITVGLHALAVPIAPFVPVLAYVLFVLTAALWIVPDKRMENLDR